MRGELFRGGPAAFLRARLHRRIFAWFGLSILVTGLALGAVSAFVERNTNSGYRREIERANGLAQIEKRNRIAAQNLSYASPWVERGSENQAGRVHAVARSSDGIPALALPSTTGAPGPVRR